jgi:1,4-alpha-glucan branching enzyme
LFPVAATSVFKETTCVPDEPLPEPSPADSPSGSFAFVLHSHIPYVLAHGQWPHGTDWLTEVAAESYIPLLDLLNGLADEGLPVNLTLGLTPILCEQLADESFKVEFTDWLEAQIGAAAADARTFRAAGDTAMLTLADRWRTWFRQTLHQFTNTYDRDIVGAFRRLQDRGLVEIITSAATHGYLPLLLTDSAVKAQIEVGVASYVRHFGRRPTGFWLPECAYRPRYLWNAPLENYQTAEPVLRRGIDEFLSDYGIRYTFIDSHLLKGRSELQGIYADRFGALKALWNQFTLEHKPERAERSEYRPYFIASSGDTAQEPVAVFSRDVRSSHAVWAADVGYPGDPGYLEFHKKHEPGRLRYWRVSMHKADMAAKALYDPGDAAVRIEEHARHFVAEMKALLEEQRAAAGESPFVAAMYDTELFGHWWHEGPAWLKAVLRLMAQDPAFDLTTCASHLQTISAEEADSRLVALPEGSWGEGGHHWIWLNQNTAWMWEKIYDAEQQMSDLVRRCAGSPAAARPLQQAARELLLLESSDWPFVTSTGGAPDYAEARVKVHHVNFTEIAKIARRAAGEGEPLDDSPLRTLAEVETRDSPFPDIDPAAWAQ